MRTYIYARVSTFDQFVNGYSADQQVRICLEYAQRSGLILGTATNCDVPGVFIDGGRSAYKKTLAMRPGGQQMLNVIEPGDTVIALATHRLFRRLSDMVAVMEKWVGDSVAVRFVDYPMLNTDTANGKAMLYILAVMAQLKSELISARVKESRGRAKEKPRLMERKTYEQIVERSGKDLGSIMQQVQLARDAQQYKFTGTVRAYIRVSTKDQTVDHQKEMIKKMIPAELTDADIVWYSDNGASAFTTKFEKRPASSRLMADLQSGDMVITWRPDRIFRSIVDAARVVEKIHTAGASIMTIEGGIRTDNPHGRMMMHMMCLFAEIESQDISRMTKLGLFGAIGSNPAARATRMPKFLREMKTHHRQKHYQFENVFTSEERFLQYIELHMTGKNYRTRREACRAISNKWLKKKGLPTMTSEQGDSTKQYIAKLKTMQKVEFSQRRERVLTSLKGHSSEEVRYPVNVMTVAWVLKRQTEFLAIAKQFKGRLRDKKSLTMLAGACASPEAMTEFLKKV